MLDFFEKMVLPEIEISNYIFVLMAMYKCIVHVESVCDFFLFKFISLSAWLGTVVVCPFVLDVNTEYVFLF